MFGNYERTYKVYMPCDDGTEPIGDIRCAVSHRSNEEVSSDDISRSSETLIGIASRRQSVIPQIVRGCVLMGDGGESFYVRYTVNTASATLLFLNRTVFDGDGGVNAG